MPSTKNSRKSKSTKDFDIKALLDKFSPNSIVCWTDGACKGNPGPSGSGCLFQVVRATKRTSFKLWRWNGKMGTSGLAELLGVELALDALTEVKHLTSLSPLFSEANLPREVHVMVDSTYAEGMCAKNWKATVNLPEVKRLRAKILELKRYYTVDFHWVKSHDDIDGNETADKLAEYAINTQTSRTTLEDAISSSRSSRSSGSSSSSSSATKRMKIDDEVDRRARPGVRPHTDSSDPTAERAEETKSPHSPPRSPPRSPTTAPSSAKQTSTKRKRKFLESSSDDEDEPTPPTSAPTTKPRRVIYSARRKVADKTSFFSS